MGLARIAIMGAIGFAGYKLVRKCVADKDECGISEVRDAGPDSMRNAPEEGWDNVDQASDESFPASDPPANY
ncbi:hypothetical protein GRI97_17540 [Altererythrobacter xixiisoli]|uniref:Uncharacterized protein n=1 Tax=Croceibacterium xixiisoli TaxID=1476466 RepID=A0A6I4TXA2_9SPHN|nr:hypothetical protein [Croceibacterium xixiisoli]